MHFCPQPWIGLWHGGAFDGCVFQTSVAIVLAIIVGVCGVVELRLYAKYGTPLEPEMLGRPPLLYVLQLSLSIFLVLVQVVRLGFRFLDPVYGYMILYDGVGSLLWLCSSALVYTHRNYDLPTTVPSNRHSLYLMAFWCAALCADTLMLVNVAGDKWFFRMSKPSEVSLAVLFIAQWLAELVVVILGARAPGIVTLMQRSQFLYRPMRNSQRRNHPPDGARVHRQHGRGLAADVHSGLNGTGQAPVPPFVDGGKYGSLSGANSPPPLHIDRANGTELIGAPGAVAPPAAQQSSTFVQSIENLKADMSSGQLADEFAGLWRQSSQGSTRAALDRTNEHLNRYWNVLPYDSNRVRMRPPQPIAIDSDNSTGNICITNGQSAKTDYINASWVTVQVPELDLENVYVAAQGPKPETIDHFWHMVCQHNISLILMLTDMTESGMQKCTQYWPEINQTMEIANGSRVLNCTHVEKNNRAGWTVRDLFVADLHQQKEWSIVQIQMHGWPDHGAPKDARRLLDFWRCAKARAPPRRQPPSLMGSSDCASGAGGFLPLTHAPILVHCSAGVGRTGAYILLETLISLIDAESPLRPIDLVAELRRQRMAMVQTEEQLLFACAAALAYFEQQGRNGTRRLLG